MNVRPNLSLFTQTDVDSSALTVHVAIAHAFRSPGRYTGSVLRGKETDGSFLLDVDPECRDMQVNIDLAAGASSAPGAAVRQMGPDCDPAFRVSPKGMVLFHVTSGPGGFAARVGPVDEKLAAEAFDSRNLKAEDIIAVTLLRPGTYRATFGHGEAKLRVTYPDRKARFAPVDAVAFEASDAGLKPDGAELQPTQGQMYRLSSSGRLRIELVEPDDGSPRDGPTSRARLVRRRETK